MSVLYEGLAKVLSVPWPFTLDFSCGKTLTEVYLQVNFSHVLLSVIYELNFSILYYVAIDNFVRVV